MPELAESVPLSAAGIALFRQHCDRHGQRRGFLRAKAVFFVFMRDDCIDSVTQS
jgi:hypothetical protein